MLSDALHFFLREVSERQVLWSFEIKIDNPDLCKDKEIIVDMTQGLDGEEAAAVVEDLVKADAMQWDMTLVMYVSGPRCATIFPTLFCSYLLVLVLFAMEKMLHINHFTDRLYMCVLSTVYRQSFHIRLRGVL